MRIKGNENSAADLCRPGSMNTNERPTPVLQTGLDLFYLPYWTSIFFFLTHCSCVSMTSGSLWFPVHRSLIKPSNQRVIHNFICSSGTWGHFPTSLKSMRVSFWKGHNSPSAAGVGVTDAKWAIYRFLVEGEYCVESFQAPYWGYMTPRGLICARWYFW